MKIIVGSTGLVGQTMCELENFDATYNSKNIDQFNEMTTDGDELFLSCLPASKWLVNKNIQQDMNNIMNIINIISKKHYSKITLISTIDVYTNDKILANENDTPLIHSLSYGSNRYIFELLVKSSVSTDDLKIFRIPALFNNKIKKNILYDLMNDNNVNQINPNSFYQWYNLNNLAKDIEHYSEMYPDGTVFNLFTEPIDTKEIIKLFPQHEDKISHKEDKLVWYDYTTKYTESGYISNKEEVFEDIKKFINEFSIK